MNKIVPIVALKDNYIWAIQSPDDKYVAVVDPGDATPVLQYLQKNQLSLQAILITHHHWDHSNGIDKLLDHAGPIPVFGSHLSPLNNISIRLKEGDHCSLPLLDYPMTVLEIPGHTLDHIAYVGPNSLFCGDTLFSCGCGRLFEGTPALMMQSLQKIKALDPLTQLYCGHEYTLANIQFAKIIEPTNIHLEKREQQVKLCRQKNLPSLPVTLEREHQTNPFLRVNHPDVIQSVQNHCGQQHTLPLTSGIDVFSYLRQWKDEFKPSIMFTK